MKTKFLLFLPFLFLGAACQYGPRRIDPTGDDAVVSAGVDYSELLEWSGNLTEQMMASGLLARDEYAPQPVAMVVSEVQNKTDLAHFPTELILSNIRQTLSKSGKARWVSTYGSDGVDSVTRETLDLKKDPLFDSSQIPEAGQATVAKLSLRTQILWLYSQGYREAQNTYVMRMWISDVRTGEMVWEGQSNPIAKKFEKGSVSW